MVTILIVDDAIDNVRILTSLVKDLGHVVFAINGQEALAQVAHHRPGLILLDVVMPEMDGREVCRRLKADAATRHIPIIFITAADRRDDEAAGLALGAIDYITKPFIPEIVRNRVRNHVHLLEAHGALRQAHDSLEAYKAAVDASTAAIFLTDRDAHVAYVNAAYSAISGFDPAEILGRTLPLLTAHLSAEAGPDDIWRSIREAVPWRGECRSQRKDGSDYWADVSIAPVFRADGAVANFVVIYSDITQRKQIEEELRLLAVTDGLTGVANRRALIESGSRELQRAQRFAEPTCVLMLDIDHFKRINDTYGHPTGDLVIRELAHLCTLSVRKIDTVGRLGGEEFAVVLAVTRSEAAMAVAQRIRESVIAAEVTTAAGQSVHFTVSIGIAEADPAQGDEDFAALLARADAALYRAKAAGRNCVETDEVVATN